MRRAVVTGLGAVTPIGNDARVDVARRGRTGESGIDFIRAFDPSRLPRSGSRPRSRTSTRAAVASPKEVRKLERNVLLALGAGARGGRRRGPRRRLRRRSASGSSSARRSAASSGSWSSTTCCASAARTASSPNFLPSVLVDTASGQLAISLGLPRPELRARSRPARPARTRSARRPRSSGAATPTPSSRAAPRRACIR